MRTAIEVYYIVNIFPFCLLDHLSVPATVLQYGRMSSTVYVVLKPSVHGSHPREVRVDQHLHSPSNKSSNPVIAMGYQQPQHQSSHSHRHNSRAKINQLIDSPLPIISHRFPLVKVEVGRRIMVRECHIRAMAVYSSHPWDSQVLCSLSCLLQLMASFFSISFCVNERIQVYIYIYVGMYVFISGPL